MELIKIKYGEKNVINEPLVATIGQFDGLHLAHITLISKTVEISKQKNLKSAIITFDPHPDFILKKDLTKTYVTPLRDKIELLNKTGLDYMILIEFNSEVASISPVNFINDYLLSNCVKEVVVGFDFAFGKFGSGKAHNIEELSNNQIKTHIVEEIKHNNQKIGTSLIKMLLNVGNVEEVNELLGRNYKIAGKVIRGNQIGRTLNLPTANFEVDEQFANICPGVYVVKIFIKDEVYYGFANLGVNPSFNRSSKMIFETHIFDFDKDIYNQIVEVEFLSFIRKEIKFESVDEFLKQITIDKEVARKFCNNLTK